MNIWAGGKYKNLVNFICICCDGSELAKAMGERMKLNQCINSLLVSQEDGPYWGQLGCSGFIILGDKLQNIISKKTKAFLDIGEKAFNHVESLLDKQLTNVRKDNIIQISKSSNSSEKIQPIKKILSVKNDELDKEHNDCSLLLVNLSNNLSKLSLQKFLYIFEKHCKHEEDMLNKYLYSQEKNWKKGSVNLLLNTRDSHFKDHKRIINYIKNEIDTNKTSKVSINFINKLLRDFENHTNIYDSSYANQLNSALK